MIPLLVTFLVNKSGTKAEFERYHECVTKFITRIKDKRLQDLQSNPFKAKAEEPEEAVLQTPTLDSLLNQAKADGFDNLFAKQNQIGGSQPQPQQKGLDFSSPSPDAGGFDFGDFNSFPSQPGANTTAGNSFGLLGNGNASGPSSGLGTPNAQLGLGSTNNTGGFGFGLPKPPEKTQTTHFKPPNVSSSAQSGGLGLMDLGFGLPQPAQTAGGSRQPGMQSNTNTMNTGVGFGLGSNNNNSGLGSSAGGSSKNYSAFDEITLNDDGGSGVLGLGGLGAPAAGGMGSGLGGFAAGQSAGVGGGASGFGAFGGLGGNMGAANSGMGGFGSGGAFGGMGAGDPFSKSSMGGLMLGETKDPFDFTAMGSNTGNSSSSMGYSSNLLGMDNTGNSNLLGGNNFGMNSMGGMGNMGGMNLLGPNSMGGYGGNSQTQATANSSKPGGLFSNPNLVVKGGSNTNQNSKPAGGNNFNDFSLL